MNIKYLFVASLTLFFAFSPKNAIAQDVDFDIMTIDAFSDDDGDDLSFPSSLDEDDDSIDGNTLTNANTLQKSTARAIYTDDFSYRWYMSLGFGSQFLMGEDDSKGSFTSRQTLAPSLTVGYRFTPAFGVRVNLSGGSLHGFNDGNSGTYKIWDKIDPLSVLGQGGYPTKEYMSGRGLDEAAMREAMSHWDPQWNYMGFSPTNGLSLDYNPKDGINGWRWNPGIEGDLYMQHVRYISVNAAVTMNIFSLFAGADDSRKFDMSLYVGPSYYHTMPHKGMIVGNGIGVNGGLQAQYAINEKFNIFTEFNGNFFPDDFDGQKGGDKGDLVGQAVLGLTYKFKADRWSQGVVVTTPTFEETDDMNDELNRLRVELLGGGNQQDDLQPEVDRLRAQLAALQAQKEPEPEPEVMQKESFYLPDPVHFAIGKSDINGEGWTVIERVAAYLNNNPDATVIITGFADKNTGNDAINQKLSRERSKKVADALVHSYGIANAKVAIDWQGSSVQPFYNNNLNRAVLFYIEFE